MAYDPKVGDVIRYDFLWKEEADQGRVNGVKDRPCAIVLASKEQEDGSRRVLIAPITHTTSSSPKADRDVEVPPAVGRHLGLDDNKSWIKTKHINQITWPKDQIPVGVVPTQSGGWTYGRLPQGLGKQVFEGVRHHSLSRSIEQVKRDSNEDQTKALQDRTERIRSRVDKDHDHEK